MFKPVDEVDPKDHIFGEVDEQSRRFYALARTYEKHAELQRKQADGLFTEASSKQKLQEDARKTDRKTKVI